jgi:hypothetical protein
LAGVLCQSRLRIEQIDLTRPTGHEKLNNSFRFGMKMRRARFQIIHSDTLSSQSLTSGKKVDSQQVRQGCAAEAITNSAEEIAAW